MFQNLASYLLGAVMTAPNPQEEVDPTAAAAAVENTSGAYGRLRASENHEEGEWVMVDRDSEGNSEAGSLCSLDFGDEDEEIEDPAAPNAASSLSALRPKARTRSSSTSSLPSCTAMEESWFVTPPPCFTSAGPVHVETSPLENLLIEHPSMSVYHIHQMGRRHMAVAVPVVRTASISPRRPASVVDLLAGDNLFDLVEEELDEAVVVNNRQRERPSIRRLNRLQVLQQQDRQLVQYKKAQKVRISTNQNVQRQRQYQNVTKNALERNDKAREMNGRNRRQRRGERSQGATRSYANNNRKCC
nr:unnamed protein product [Callosobruchus chinensis]